MKNITLALFWLSAIMGFVNAAAQVGIGTTAPEAALDVTSTSSGFLPPRVALTGTGDISTVVNPQSGTLIAGTIVYNTATAGAAPNNVIPGYYFWKGSTWERFSSQTSTTHTALIQLPVKLSTTGSNNPVLVQIFGTLDVFSFSGTAINEVFFTMQLPQNWVEGTRIFPTVTWMPLDSSPSANVQWFIDYSWANPNIPFSAGGPTFDSSASGIGSTGPIYNNNHTSVPTGGIDGTGFLKNSVIIGRVYRNGNSSNVSDTYAGNVGGLTIDFEITVK